MTLLLRKGKERKGKEDYLPDNDVVRLSVLVLLQVGRGSKLGTRITLKHYTKREEEVII